MAPLLRALLERIRSREEPERGEGAPRDEPPHGRAARDADAAARLVSAVESEARFRRDGANLEAALRGARAQVAGLRAEIDDEQRWPRLREMARRIGDPWNADDWPLGFDPLLLVVPLCKRVDYECERCPVGERQASRSCAHPDTPVGRLGAIIREGDRRQVREALQTIDDRVRDCDPG